MLRDNSLSYNPPAPDDLSAKPNQEIDVVLNFIDANIGGFIPYYASIKDSDRENRISDFLSYYFNTCLRQMPNDFLPINFVKNPTQSTSGKETDIGVVILAKNVKPITIIEFEAKRLSDTSKNKEYVCGLRGGIERLKREEHASQLKICGMFGYIQSVSTPTYTAQINELILDLCTTNKDTTISWTKEEQLVFKYKGTKFEKWFSSSSRTTKDNIDIHHYFLELC